MKYRTALITTVCLAFSAPVFADDNIATQPTSIVIAQEQTTPSIDPYEPYNRFMYKVNDKADRYILKPIAKGYRAVTPKPVRTGVSNFFNNLRDVVSMGSNLLRLDIKRASEDFMRVAINTTFGLGGLIDVADAGQMPNNKNTLGDTFASWGWKNSNYFVYPLLGPSTVRDSVGSTIVSIYPVQNAIFQTSAGRMGAAITNGINTRENLLDLTNQLEESALDPYIMTRDLYMQMRNQQVGGTLKFNSPAEENIDIDSLVDPEESESNFEVEASQPLSDGISLDVQDMQNNENTSIIKTEIRQSLSEKIE